MGDVVKKIAHQRHDAELALHRGRVVGKLPHGGRNEADEQQQRQGEQQLCHRLHQRMLREEQRYRQRRPACAPCTSQYSRLSSVMRVTPLLQRRIRLCWVRLRHSASTASVRRKKLSFQMGLSW